MGDETAERRGGCSGEVGREVHADSVHSSGVGWGEIAKPRLTIGATEDDLGSISAPWADTEDREVGERSRSQDGICWIQLGTLKKRLLGRKEEDYTGLVTFQGTSCYWSPILGTHKVGHCG